MWLADLDSSPCLSASFGSARSARAQATIRSQREPMSTSVTRALKILELLGKAEKPMSLATISATLQAPKSTIHGLLGDLLNESFIELASPGKYVIGLKTFEVGSARIRHSGTMAAVAPELSVLTAHLAVTSHYAVLDGTEAVYLWKEDPPLHGIQLASAVGIRLPAQWTAVGKACLAWLQQHELINHVNIRATNACAETKSLSQLAEELQLVRARGYSTDVGDTARGVECLAAPVFDLAGCCGAIGVSYLRDSGTDRSAIANEVTVATQRASSQLGGRL